MAVLQTFGTFGWKSNGNAGSGHDLAGAGNGDAAIYLRLKILTKFIEVVDDLSIFGNDEVQEQQFEHGRENFKTIGARRQSLKDSFKCHHKRQAFFQRVIFSLPKS